MGVRVIYSTEAFSHKNQGQVGRQCESSFDSIDAAKAAPLSEGFPHASIAVENGYHVYSTKFGWEFYKAK